MEAVRTTTAPHRRPLRRTIALALLPLCLVVGAGLWRGVVDARSVHHDLQRMFEELREIGAARVLLDDLHGIEQWVEAVPEATEASHRLVIEDLRHHHAAACTTLDRVSLADDPSEEDHAKSEAAIVERVRSSLDAIGAMLSTGGPIAALRPPLAIALHSAEVLAHTVENETREIGAELDSRSEAMTQFMIVLGFASAATVLALAWLLHRIVILPVRELRAGALALGSGEDVQWSRQRADELGDLANAFRAMATQLQENRRDLERRVDERTREVIRTAQLAQLGTLAAGIAHEINNPLASIAACAEGLLREQGSSAADRERLREYLQIVRKEAMRARDITARLLRFARRDPARRETVWLGTEIHEVAPLFEHQLADAGVTLSIDAEARGPTIVGDPSEWRQVLFNLLRNALDATPRGGRIELVCKTNGDRVELVVSDDGSGIPATALDRIFEPFFTTKEPGKGTGLGLAIVHRIVTGHGGTITAANGTRGARFSISLPLAAAR